MDLRAVLIEIHTALQDAGVDHALIGGLAFAAHGGGRATVDVDFLAEGERADDIDRMVVERGYACLHRSEHAANYASDSRERGRVDFLFARRKHGREMLDRAREHDVAGRRLRVIDASDLVGLKVQSSSNDPSRRHRDLADVEWLLAHADLDLERVREVLPHLRPREGARRDARRDVQAMRRPVRDGLEGMRDEALSAEMRRSFAESSRAVAAWERERPRSSLGAVLDWADELRRAFGEPPVDRRPWLGDDFRL